MGGIKRQKLSGSFSSADGNSPAAALEPSDAALAVVMTRDLVGSGMRLHDAAALQALEDAQDDGERQAAYVNICWCVVCVHPHEEVLQAAQPP